jgi:hypothetical protein
MFDYFCAIGKVGVINAAWLKLTSEAMQAEYALHGIFTLEMMQATRCMAILLAR